MWIFLTQFAIKWQFSFFYLTQCLLLNYLVKENQAKYALKYAKKREKNIPNIIDRNLKHDCQISIIIGLHISDTTGY